MANAGPPALPSKDAKKKGKSPAAADNDEQLADDGEAAASAAEEQAAEDQLLWWEFGKGPYLAGLPPRRTSGNREAWMESATSEFETVSQDESGQPHLLLPQIFASRMWS